MEIFGHIVYNRIVRKEDKSMVSVQALANTVLKRAYEEEEKVTPMKLQKLMYFICRNYLKKTNKELVEESFLAWDYGPVLRSAYDEFKPFGAKPITRFAKNSKNEVYIINESINNDITEVIDDVWQQYKSKNGIELSEITHQEDGAWHTAYYNRGRGCVIKAEEMKRDEVG